IRARAVLPQAARTRRTVVTCARRYETLLFAGDDWAEDYHDVELQDETGRKLAARRLPEGAAGIARLHALRRAPPRRESFPAALLACADPGLTGTGTLELLARAPAPAAAAKLTAAQISAPLKRARRHDI